MAKSLIKPYVLTLGTAGNSTLVIPGKYDLNQLLLITNTTRNIIYYNFSDSTYANTSVSFTRANNTTAVIATSTVNSASSASTTLTATTATGTVVVGMTVSGSANIPTGTTITAVSGTTLTLSTATTGAVSNATLTFTGSSFNQILANSDGYTTITLQVDTSSHNINDNIQIFVDNPVQLVRMSGVGTDAFERSRVAAPQSMLDADFEYGLQPTKWQVIDMMRGYPSIYEVPGTDTSVTSLVTDASSGTANAGESLITLTTTSAHGFVTGNPITIKGLANTVSGFARAEGTFLINSVTGTNTFNYYAKAKVGTSVVTATSTTNSAASGSTALTATTATGTITVGQVVSGSANIPTGTTVTAVSGTSITLSAATTNIVTNASLTFTGEVISTTYTQLRKGGFFTGASIGAPTFAVQTQSDGSTTFAVIEVTFASAHGLVPGDTIISSISSSGSNHAYANGPFYVEQVPTSTTLRYTARAIGIIASSITGSIYARPDCFYSHRPFDGGVMLGTGGPSHGAHAIRMSKKYIRYQSGKSINYNTGLLMAPNYDVRSVTATNTSTTTYTTTTNTGTALAAGSTSIVITSGTNVVNGMLVTGGGIPAGTTVTSGGGTTTIVISNATTASTPNGTTLTFYPTITITTDDVDHGCQVGAVINLLGVTTSGYNGNYTVTSITSERILTCTVATTLGSTTAVIASPCTLSLVNWVGSTVRAGTFDDQNGQYWQYDGQTVAVGYRSSTFQLSGVVDVNADSNTVTQSTNSSTRFQDQLGEGDRVVIKGMSHVVSSIGSNTTMSVTPDYRGSVNATGVKMVKTRDFLYTQSQWNIDRCDGTNGPFNPSGYNLNPNKMQMVSISWTWYGAGFIEWMLRGPDGNYIPVHRVKASNVNTEAYMRSGNQPVRYEVQNESARTYLNGDLAAATTTIPVIDTTYFPTAGVLWLEGEIIRYTGKTTTSFTGCTRAATDFILFAGGQNRTFTGGSAQSTTTSGTGIILISQTATPIVSHWGSAFLQDGGFDADRGYIFNYAATNISISTRKTTAFAIRLAPSVSNAIIGDLGVRDLLNRAQLLLEGIEITAGAAAATNAGIVIEGVLNPTNYPTTLSNITWNSLQGSTAGGLPSFAQIATGSSITFDNQNTSVLSTTATSTYTTVGTTTIAVASVSGIAIGDDVYSTSNGATFAGGTKVTAISGNTITLSQGIVGTITTSVTNVSFSRSTAALPGETIFSFISNPSSKDSLDLSPLKELVNTPIGGRGTFPNGPDVLMINVYLTQGAPLTANLILRWSEAQA
jgi:hypothetical protein